ncbi:MAG: cytochrome c-type biogenesis protein CcmH [Rhodobacterales bacterium]|nr:cytochrome c-type biogenesis protein CcmH [Rhodobacterales bacterium]
MRMLLMIWLMVAALAAGPADDPGAGLIAGLPPGPAPSAEEVVPRTHAIAVTLRCPVCQGLSVADSTSPAAVAFQRRIQELVALGYTDQQIRDYFIDRYGEWILLDPNMNGLNAVLYLLPGILLGLGAVWVGATVAQWRKEPSDALLPSEVGAADMDDYERRLLKELDE